MIETDQIAAEAAVDFIRTAGKFISVHLDADTHEVRKFIEQKFKDAIEKATEIAVRETSDYIMAKLRQQSRAAHASEQK